MIFHFCQIKSLDEVRIDQYFILRKHFK